MKKLLEESVARSRANCPETNSWPLGRAICMTGLLANLGLATVHAAPNVVAWGLNFRGQTDVPADLTNAVAVSGGLSHSLALRADGTVAAWGDNEYGQADVPPGLTNVAAVAAGYWHSLALRADGSVVAWGHNTLGQTDAPAGLTNVVAVAAGGEHSLALRANGTVVTWGLTYGTTAVPRGLSNVVTISRGGSHCLALQADGTVLAWGENAHGQTDVPPDLTNAVAVAAGCSGPAYSLALRADGTVIAWRGNNFDETHVPTGLSNVSAIAAGGEDCFSVVLTAEGHVATWGGLRNAPMTVRVGLRNVTAVAAGGSHCLAIVGAGPPMLTAPILDREVFVGGTVHWQAAASGSWPLSYQWQFNGTNLPGATNSLLVLTNADATMAGAYSVVVANALGSATSSPAFLRLVPTLVNTPPQDQVGYVGGSATFIVKTRASVPVTYQWQFRGTNLPSATNASLVLSGLRRDQAGPYSVVVGNLLGVVTSREADLSVGMVVAWGEHESPVTSVPAGLTNVIAVADGGWGLMGFVQNSIALHADGTVVAWGYDWIDVQAGLTNAVAVAAGGYETRLALGADGTIVAVGGNEVPAGLTNIVAVSVRGTRTLALCADGTVIDWLYNGSGQTNVPTWLTNVVAVAAGAEHSLALRADGTVIAWGAGAINTGQWPNLGQSMVPPGLTDVVAVAAGDFFSLALRADGTVVAWGDNYTGQTNVPVGLTNAVAIAGCGGHSLALRADGTVVAWGENQGGQTNVPVGLTNVVAVAAGSGHNLALIGDGPPVVNAFLNDPIWSVDGFSVSLPTQSGRVYALEYKASLEDAAWTPLPLVAGSGHERTLTDLTATGTQRFYRVRRW